MFLSAKELKEFTGCKTAHAQAKWLKANGVKHFVNPSGAVKVPSVVAKRHQAKASDPFEKALAKKLTVPIHQAGVYFLKHGDETVYIGKTTNFFARVGRHMLSGMVFDAIDFLPLGIEKLDLFEREYIARLGPKYNVAHVEPLEQTVPQIGILNSESE